VVVVDAVEKVTEEQELGRDRRVGFELADPVSVRGLEAEQMRLGARDRIVQVPHGRDGNMQTR